MASAGGFVAAIPALEMIRANAGQEPLGFVALSSQDTMWIDGNTLAGPGGDYDPEDHSKWSGVLGDWMCGAGTRKVWVAENGRLAAR